jgi:glycosyltransferase involved in cell wall biosynthesis
MDDRAANLPARFQIDMQTDRPTTRALNCPQPSICFIGMNNYGLLSGREDIPHIGGAEVQRMLIARELHSRGYRVSFVTLDHGQPDGIEHGGVRVYKAYDLDKGLRFVRFVHPRWTGLWSAMARADADIYCARGADNEAGQAVLWCRRHKRSFIFWGAIDADFMLELPLTSPTERWLSRLAVRSADVIIAQTKTQQQLLARNYGLSSAHIPNLGRSERCGAASTPNVPLGERRRVLWVGRPAEQKRFEWLLDLARICPDVTFEAAGISDSGSGYERDLALRAAPMSNVRMHGRVPPSGMPSLYAGASLLCSTSAHEGFPNVFLEAWSMGLPVVSTFDPDGVIAATGSGLVAGSVEGLAKGIREMFSSGERWAKASSAARKYYVENHSPTRCIDKFEEVLGTLRSPCPTSGADPNR